MGWSCDAGIAGVLEEMISTRVVLVGTFQENLLGHFDEESAF